MDSGDSVLHTVPIFESYALPHAILHWDLAGCALVVYLMRLSSERGYSFTTTEEREMGRGVKEKLCFIAFKYDTELKSFTESSNKKQTHVLSGGHNISVGAECFRCECFSSQVSLAKVPVESPNETDGIGSIHDVFSRASLSSIFFFQRMLTGFGSIRDAAVFFFSFPCHRRTATPCHRDAHIQKNAVTPTRGALDALSCILHVSCAFSFNPRPLMLVSVRNF